PCLDHRLDDARRAREAARLWHRPPSHARTNVVASHRLRAPRAGLGSALPPLRLDPHHRDIALRLHRVQGALPLPRLPRSLRPLQALLSMSATPPRFVELPIVRVSPEAEGAVAITLAVPPP